MQAFDFNSLLSQKKQVIKDFHDKGIIAVRGVPGFVAAYENFIESARNFINLSEESKEVYTPYDASGRGWSYGIEKYKDVADAFKGSYYITLKKMRPSLTSALDKSG